MNVFPMSIIPEIYLKNIFFKLKKLPKIIYTRNIKMKIWININIKNI